MSRTTLNNLINTKLATGSDITAAELREVHTAQADYGDEQDALKVDKVNNKSLVLDTEITKLATVAANATANATDAQLRDRTTHTGTQTSASISDFTEAVQDAVAAFLGAGSNVVVTYNDAANSLTISSTGGGSGGLDAETVRDVIGAAIIGVGNITVAYNDTLDTITVSTTATVNSTDAALRDRSTHTGTQLANTISNFNPAVDARIPSNDFDDTYFAGDGSDTPYTVLKSNTAPSGVNTGNETNTSIGALINAATHKATPQDGDKFGFADSAASFMLKEMTWSDLKAALKEYFDTQYQPGGNTTPSAPNVSGDDTANTITVTHTLGSSEIEANENGGGWVALTSLNGWNAVTSKINVGNVARSTGYWLFRTKVASGRNVSPTSSSPAFTISGGGSLPAPVAEWLMDEGTGSIANDNIGSNDFTLMGSPSWGTGSLVWDGVDDYGIKSSCNLGLNNSTEMSLSLWIKTSDTSGRIIQKEISDGVNTCKVQLSGAGIFTCSVGNGTLAQIAEWTTINPVDSNWHLLTFTFKKNSFDANDLIVYIDHSPVSTTFSAGGYNSDFVIEEISSNLYVACRPVSISDFFGGEIKKIRIWNAKLSSLEEAQIS